MKDDKLVVKFFLDRREYTKRAFSETDPVLHRTVANSASGGCQCVNCRSCDDYGNGR